MELARWRTLFYSVFILFCLVTSATFLPQATRGQTDGEVCDGDSGCEAENVIYPGPQLLSGYAWTSTFGWISFGNNDYDSTTHGVWLPPANGWDEGTNDYTGPPGPRYLGGRSGHNFNVPGYAWSPNIGWIRFGGDWEDYPSALDNFGARLSSDGSHIEGWARACSVFETGCSGALKLSKKTGGWDGWFKFNGVTVATGDPYASSLDVPLGTVIPVGFLPNSYAWGGDGLGWISWCAQGNIDYCLSLAGLGLDISLSTDSSGSEVNLAAGQDITVAWTGYPIMGTTPYHYEWSWSAHPGYTVSGNSNGNFVGLTRYYCEDPEGDISPGTGDNSGCTEDEEGECHSGPSQEAEMHAITLASGEGVTVLGTARLTDNAGDAAMRERQLVLNCGGPTDDNDNDDDIPVLGTPTTPVIYIATQPLGSAALSSGTSLSNTGEGSATVTIRSTTSLVDSSKSLDNLEGASVRCRLATSVLQGRAGFEECNDNNQITSASGGNVYFNIVVDPNPSVELLKYSPYQIVIGPPEDQDGATASFNFEYKAGILNQT